MQDELIEKLWRELQVVFGRLVVFVDSVDRNFKHTIGRNNNEAFPMRAYLSIMRSDSGEELAITVDVKIIDDQLLIESDICSDGGAILAEGPSIVLKKVVTDDISNTEVLSWLRKFEEFLANNRETLKVKLLHLA